MSAGRPVPIKFGTDGWRAIIAEDFTFENVRLCAQSVADYLHDQGTAARGLVVGYDTRFGSERFAAAVAEVVAANGIKVYLSDRAAPTPVSSYAVIVHKAAGGVIITASHNPGEYNGFKYKPDYGGSAPPEITDVLERRCQEIADAGTVKRASLEAAQQEGLVESFNPETAYMEHISRLVDLPAIRRAGLRVAVDSMYGAGAGYLAKLLAGGSTTVYEIHGERNPAFPGIRPEPIPPNTDELLRTIVELGADVGLATDGDADRLGVADERGIFITQLQVYALLALYLLEVRGERGPLVKALTTTSMANVLGRLYNVPVYETPVGFKYVGPVMMREDGLLGGEESGGYGFRGHIPERDGVLAGLYILDLMVKLGKRPSELIEYLYSRVGPHYYDRIDVHYPADQRQAILDRVAAARPDRIDGSPVAKIDTLDGYRFVLEDGSWLLIRFSGTEPLLRIYTETTGPSRVPRILEFGRELAGV